MSDEPDPIDGRALLSALKGAEVEFIVIGGLAVGAHGHVRATKDLDIVPGSDPANQRRLAELLPELEYEIGGMDEFEADELVRPDVEALSAGGNWVLNTRLGRLDILQHVEPNLDYEKLAAEAIDAEVFGLEVRFCGYEHLRAMKRAAGRPQDLVDLTLLSQARGESEAHDE